jgi:hypothetical protein
VCIGKSIEGNMMIELSDEVRAEIAADLRKTRAPSRTAKNLAYPITLVLQVAEEYSEPRSRHEERFGGHGRPELEPYTVARKKAWAVWDNDSEEIAYARACYEAGTHLMATGRDGDWLIMYLIPQKKTTPRPNYFQPEIAL